MYIKSSYNTDVDIVFSSIFSEVPSRSQGAQHFGVNGVLCVQLFECCNNTLKNSRNVFFLI